jgi:hypothetical protein
VRGGGGSQSRSPAALAAPAMRSGGAARLPRILETGNVPLYQHFGFHVTGTLDLPKGAPVVTTMWRPGDLRDDAG